MGIVNNASAEVISGSSGAALALGGTTVETDSLFTATVTTTDATPTPLYADPIAAGETVVYEIVIVCREPATGDSRMETITLCAENTGGTTGPVGPPDGFLADVPGSSGWSSPVIVDDTSDSLLIDVIGEAAHTIDWKVKVTATRV